MWFANSGIQKTTLLIVLRKLGHKTSKLFVVVILMYFNYIIMLKKCTSRLNSYGFMSVELKFPIRV